MKNLKKRFPSFFGALLILSAFAVALSGCPSDTGGPEALDWSTEADFNPVNTWNRPMLWSVYEYHRWQEDQKNGDFPDYNYIHEDDLRRNIDWVEANLLDYGYNYIAIDGWGTGTYNEYGYRIKHDYRWQYTYREWSDMLRDRGMKLAMYDNPLWVNKGAADAGVKIRGTDYYLRDIVDWDTPNLWFYWVEVDRPGAEEYIKGNIRHWAEMGVDYLKMDFFSWYEDGYDKWHGSLGRTDRPREHYETALRWIREEADKQGVFLSLAMANGKNNAELEAKYCHMIRISDDIWAGDWAKFANNDRNKPRMLNGQPFFPQYTNMFDGFIYYSSLGGPGKVLLDGDYGWLNTNYWGPTKTDGQKRTIITLHVVAGGILSLTDQYNTAGADLRYYQNRNLTDLVREGFIAKPLSNSLATDDASTAKSHVWWGRTQNGDYVAAFFNRESSAKSRSIVFSTDLGITVDAANPMYVRELWNMTSPAGSSITTVTGTLDSDTFTINNLPANGDCRIFRISRNPL